MAFSAQTFSVGQVLTASQLNQMDSNIDAVRTFHKGSTAPADLTAGVMWIEDDNPSSSIWSLEVYDGTDWIHLARIDSTNNVAGARRLFDGDADSKLEFETDDQLDLYFSSTQYGLFKTDQWVFGHGSALTTFGAITPGFQFHGSGLPGSDFSITGWSNTPLGPRLVISKSKNSTIGSHTVVGNGDGIGAILFYGSDGTDFEPVVSIEAETDGAPSNNDMPGRLVISTTADGQASTTEAMRITSQQHVLIGKTALGNANTGIELRSTGLLQASVDGATVATFNRRTDDGTILQFSQAESVEGDIDVSGTTVSYNAFTGAHWAQWSTTPIPTPPEGTLVCTVDEEFEREYVERTVRRNDRNTIEFERFVGQALQDGDRRVSQPKPQLSKVRITDTQADPRIYGVYAGIKEGVPDIRIFAIGTVPKVRVIGPVKGGDLLQSSAIPGIAEKQPDDVIRACTLGKVSRGTDVVGETTVPAVLYCG